MTSHDDFASVAERIVPGALLRSVSRLTGGVSAHVHALELQDTDGYRRTLVVRQQGAAEWKPQNEQAVAMEYRLLQALFRAGFPVPEPLLLDTTGYLLRAPFLVMTFIDGSTDIPTEGLCACLDMMADTLVRLHTQRVEELPELPLQTDPLPELFQYLPELPEWHPLREYLSQCTDAAFQDRPVLLHGDFWPGNLLWRDLQLVAIVDWEDAALGDPMSDVAGCRIELLWKYGSSAMDRFTQAYARANPLDPRRLALWEVVAGCAAAHFMGDWGLDSRVEADMRRKANAFAQKAARRLLFEPHSS